MMTHSGREAQHETDDGEGAPRVRVVGALQAGDVADLLREQFDAPQWIIPGQLGEGVTALASAPKLGKTLTAIGRALWYACQQAQGAGHEVLYISLDDRNKRRFRDRARSILQDRNLPHGRFFYAMEANSLRDGLVTQLRLWMRDHPETRLMVIDLYASIKPRRSGGDVVKGDYDAMDSLRQFANEQHIAMLLLHHTRKRVDTEDWLADISGSFGVGGGVDGVWKLERPRDGRGVTLKMTHRDMLADCRVLFDLDDDLMADWTPEPAALGETPEAGAATGGTAQAVLDALGGAGGCLWPRQIAECIGGDVKEAAVRRAARRMLTAGAIAEASCGAYTLPGRSDICTQCKMAVIASNVTPSERDKAGNSPDNRNCSHDNGQHALCSNVTPTGLCYNPAPIPRRRSLDALRTDIVAAGRRLGWPRHEYRQANWIAGGRESWERFLASAERDKLEDMALSLDIPIAATATSAPMEAETEGASAYTAKQERPPACEVGRTGRHATGDPYNDWS